MSKQMVVTFTVLTLAAACSASGFASFPICTGPVQHINPWTDGNRIVWMDNRTESSNYVNWHVYAYDVATGVTTDIGGSPYPYQNPSVAGNVVVWRTAAPSGLEGNIRGYDLATSQSYTFNSVANTGNTPAISGRRVVWMDNRNATGGNESDIYGYDLNTGQEFPICTDLENQSAPAIDGDNVVWIERRASSADICGKNLATGQLFRFSAQGQYPTRPAIDGSDIVWQNGNGAVWHCDLATGISQMIGHGSRLIAVDQGVAVYDDYRDNKWSVFGFDLQSNYEFPICVGTDTGGGEVAIAGNLVVWGDSRNGGHDIYAATIPEPTSLAILALGGLALLRRRKGNGSC